MSRRSLLLVSYHYLPAATPGSRRLDAVARLLTARGWRVTVLTATGARSGVPDPEGIEVIRTTRTLGRSGDGDPGIASPRVSRLPLVRRISGFPDKYAPWAVTLTPRLVRLAGARAFDVVMSSSPPHSMHVAIAAAHSLRRFPWVAEFRDPWMFPSRRETPPPFAALQRRMERGVLRAARIVIANTPGNREILLAANPDLDPARVRVSTNGFDARLFAADAWPDTPAESADLTYVGEIYHGMLEPYLSAIDSIRARGSALIPRLAVYGTIDAREKQRIAAMGLESLIEDRGFVPHEQSIRAMKNARALLVLLPARERWRTCVPSKMYWYLAARRPIIALVPDGDAATLVREMHAGQVLSHGSPAELGRRLEEWVVQSRGAPVPRLDGRGTERYSMEAVVDGLERVLEEVIDGRSA